MNEKVKIISDGIHTEVWIDGIKCTGLNHIEFVHDMPTTCSTMKLGYIVPAIKPTTETTTKEDFMKKREIKRAEYIKQINDALKMKKIKKINY